MGFYSLFHLARALGKYGFTDPRQGTPRLRQKGVYLITGGLGGIGLVIAHHLTKTVQAKLILTTRSTFPGKEEEKEIPEEWADKIRKVRELEEMGAEVMVVTADTANKEQMQTAVSHALERFGTINGVIHCAGLPDGAAIQVRTKEMTDAILAPKVKGTLVLEETLKGIEPDFVVYCSSMNAILPAFGQVGHCGANAFLDAFAINKMYRGGPLTVSVNWNPWLEVGQAVESMNELAADSEMSQLDGLLSAEGVDVFMRILADALPQVVVSTNDFNVKFQQFHSAEAPQTREDADEDESMETLRSRPELDSVYVPPRNDIEKVLVKIRQKFFGFQQVGIYDDFFALGGDSLKAMTIITKIHRELKVKIPLAEIFTYPTIVELSEFIAGDNKEKKSYPIKKEAPKKQYMSIPPAEKKEYYVLSSNQKRLYILQQLEPDSAAYNIPHYIPLTDDIEIEKLETIFMNLLDRHESLRTSFHIVNEEPVQKIHDKVEFAIHYHRYHQPGGADGNLADPGINIELERIRRDFVKPFDPSRAPLLRAAFVEIEGKEREAFPGVLFLDMHHIITDGTSQAILAKEFMSLYKGETLTPLRLQYKDFSRWQKWEEQQKPLKQQEQYWLSVFSGELPVLNLPTDYPRPLMQRFEGNTVNFVLSVRHTGTLRDMARQADATLYMSILAVYTILLYKLNGQEDIVVGTPIAARRHADLETIIGMFANTLALRNYPCAEKTFHQYLKEIKERTLAAFENQEYQFEALVEKVSVRRDTSVTSLLK
jgi:NAD(P)-dependent dehydrogenase (short-subunit alcohol dehydrogenase family)/acyl carrier protein